MQFLTLFLHVYCYSRFSRDMTIHQCDTCQKNFKEKRELRHHVKRVHKGELNFLCEQCSRPFVDEYALKKHVANVHDTDKKFKCSQCDRGFGVRSHYNEHMVKVHEESHKLTCEFCGKGKRNVQVNFCQLPFLVQY